MEAFGVNRHIKSGINSICKSCGAKASAAYVKAHPESIFRSNHSPAGKAKLIRYRKKHKEKLNAQMRQRYYENRESILAAAKIDDSGKEVKRKYRLKNRESINARIAAWQKLNPEKGRAKTARHRSAKHGACVKWATDFFIDEIYSLASLRTKVTGIKWSVDHIVPLQSKIVCGLHCEANMRVIPAVMNSAKRNHYWPDMPEVHHG